MLDAEKVSQFDSEGYCILDGVIAPYQAVEILGVCERLAEALLRHESDKGETGIKTIDSCQPNKFLELVASRRPDAGRVFDALIKIPEVNRIAYSVHLQRLAKVLLKAHLVLSPPSQMNLRADHPKENDFLYPWHTDYSYNGGSLNSLVFWIPLQEVDVINGALHIIPGSHRLNHKIQFDDRAIEAKRSANYFSIENIGEVIGKLGELRCPLKLGQAVVFHSSLLHKSGMNQSCSTRYAIQSRWFDALALDSVVMKFRCGIDEGLHPRDYL